MGIKERSPEDMPREKLSLRGPQSLTNEELLAIILRTGMKGKDVLDVAHELLSEFGSLKNLASQSVESILRIQGIGPEKASTLVASFELNLRIRQELDSNKRIKVTSPKVIAEYFIPYFRDKQKEQFLVVTLNSANIMERFNIISEGSLNTSIVHPREVFKTAIDNRAANIILIHNHPSGNPEPSKEDIEITKKLVDAGRILDIKIFDHIIIAGNFYVSFVEKRII
ncbi:MAG: DNA repair protein RadC [Melioribacteraceae bacterium]|nr:DNA repair protein RadC [Melioribacteraceae bacterium]